MRTKNRRLTAILALVMALTLLPINAFAAIGYDVTVSADPAEGGSATGGGVVMSNRSTTVTATPNEYYDFDGWYEGTTKVSEEMNYTFTPTADVTLTAKFTKWWHVTIDMSGGRIKDLATNTWGGTLSTYLPPGFPQDVPTVEWMNEAFADGSWVTGPADGEYLGVTITDANGSRIYQPGEPYVLNSDATIKVLWSSDTPTPPIPSPDPIIYTVTGGADSTWTKGSDATVTITVKRSEDDANCIKYFDGVEIDGTALVKDTDYTAVSGSTVVTLNASALQKLSVGKHTVTVNFDDGSISTGLTVKQAAGTDKGRPGDISPKTGDESSQMLWFVVMIAMMLVLFGIRKRKPQRNVR